MTFSPSQWNRDRNRAFWAVIIFFILLYTIVQYYDGSSSVSLVPFISNSSSFLPSAMMGIGRGEAKVETEKTFLEIAKESGTSKVIDVQYQCMYTDALAPYRHIRGLKILEIGLGCGMWYGPGASFKLWSSYFADAQIYFLEYDKTCGQNWFNGLQRTIKAFPGLKPPIMTYGDQTDKKILKQLEADHGPWDIIIDDGCHQSRCQIASFYSLFGSVNPGGTYFIEDLYIWQIPRSKQTINMIAEVYAGSLEKNQSVLGFNLDRLTCCDAVCALRKKPV